MSDSMVLDISTNIKNKRNFATSTNIIFQSNLLEDESYFVQNIELPGLTFTTPEGFKPNTPFHTSYPFEADSIDYDPLTLTLLVDEDLEIYKSIVNKAKLSTIGARPGDNSSWVHIKDANGNTRLEMVFKDCQIINIGSLSYTSTDEQDANLIMSLTLIYSEFDIIKKHHSKYELRK